MAGRQAGPVTIPPSQVQQSSGPGMRDPPSRHRKQARSLRANFCSGVGHVHGRGQHIAHLSRAYLSLVESHGKYCWGGTEN